MNGILCIDKPVDFTSFDVVAKLRRVLGTKKIGHGGTLDPMATGVLPLFVGTATKAVDLVPCHDKRYTATFKLGTVTDTLDITGKVLAQHPVTATKAQVAEALGGFVGKVSQLPPMYSAVQVNGVRLYDLARQGVEVERKPREVEFYHIRLLEWDEETGTYTVDTACSKGTYIRTLCHDVGRLLGCGAMLTGLRRTQSGGFMLRDCITIEEAMDRGDKLRDQLEPVETVFASLPRLTLDILQAKLLQNGVRLSLEEFTTQQKLSRRLAAYTVDERFLGLVEPDLAAAELRVVKLFSREAAE